VTSRGFRRRYARRVRAKRVFLTGFAALAAVAASLAFPASAAAEDVPFTLSEPAVQQVEYGRYWSFQGASDYLFSSGLPTTVTSTSPDLPGYAFSSANYLNPNVFESILVLSPAAEAPPLAPGTYAIAADWSVASDPPRVAHFAGATLTITPAALGVAVEVAPDSQSAGGVLISGRLTGGFVDSVPPFRYSPSTPVLPAGSWTFVITDSTGERVLERTLEDAEAGLPGVSLYWNGAKPEERYTVTTAFTVAPESAANFTVGASAPAEFASTAVVRPTPTPEAPTPPPVTAESEFTAPVGALVLVGVVLLGLVIAALVLGIRLRSRLLEQDPDDKLEVAS
jgi:hypothetical protein